MKTRCCRKLPRCASCPVVHAARTRAAARDGDLFALVRSSPPRELPACVREALRSLEDRRLLRDGRD